MMPGGFAELIRFWMAIISPHVFLVLAQETIWMAALGADALAHSTSRAASPSSPATSPGAWQLLAREEPAGWTVVSDPEVYLSSPNVERNVDQSWAV